MAKQSRKWLKERRWLRERVRHLLGHGKQMDIASCLGGEGAVSKFFKKTSAPNPTLSSIQSLADYFGISVPELFGGPAMSAHGKDAVVQDLIAIIESGDPELIKRVEWQITITAEEARAVIARKKKEPDGKAAAG